MSRLWTKSMGERSLIKQQPLLSWALGATDAEGMGIHTLARGAVPYTRCPSVHQHCTA